MVEILLYTSMILIGISFVLVTIRFLIGNTIADRVVALDTLTVSTIGLIVMLAHFMGRAIYIDISIVYGILSFIGVIFIAKFLEKSF